MWRWAGGSTQSVCALMQEAALNLCCLDAGGSTQSVLALMQEAALNLCVP